MGPKHTKHDILAGAVEAASADGLNQLTFGRVAKQLGINDRTVVYYFPTKDDLVGEVVGSLGSELQRTLSAAFVTKAEDHIGLLRSAWPVLANSESDPVFALFFEAIGLAIAGRSPFRELVPALVGAWVEWLEAFIDGEPAVCRVEAETAIAVIDGLLLLRQIAGPEAADRAAERLGIA